ncbi:radical SAM protein [Nitrosomonas eutropha]|uniref:radical SAM protein n=1 Tax=Nitrosomonas eutropha TaxID=916 RepID=UPI0008D524E6|nr:radical SAM protein [Nitrosomonas eutropha]SEI78473.1 Radical SAM superfamily protein [Nitrosomonas eutropha]
MPPTAGRLSQDNHSRDSAGLTYVYPVISRRAGGISIGINLNPNNACNWRCIYCQVPDLKRGVAPAIDLIKLEQELRAFLYELLFGNFMLESVPLEARIIKDIALSGNGEPTSAREFEQIIEIIGRTKADFPLPEKLKLVLITNGSLINRVAVQKGLRRMAELNGEVWFKLDSVTQAGHLHINNTRASLQRMRDNLRTAASLCPIWLQTCVFKLNGAHPNKAETDAYICFVRTLLLEGTRIQGVLLYTLARPALQPEATILSKADPDWIEALADKIRALGIQVKTTA